MRFRLRLAATLVLALTLSCATVQENPKAVLGSVVGAAAGGGIAAVAGASSGWIVASALAGGLLGGVIGNRLDARDKQMAAMAAQEALEGNRTGQAETWRNPDSGNSGSVTPTRTYQSSEGRYCREYRQDVRIGEEKHQAYGTACRQPDGTWKIQG